ncbi:hypothetical protein [Sphingomonas sp. 1P08PE]|uniref:hypothetical protein n=1 Tax=Sphingomonas sp. 1P08PE TaxID=554122 RepID=UPI00399F678D
MYDVNDPRSTLSSAATDEAKAPVLDYADAELIEFHKVPPSEVGLGYRTWYGRGQNFVLSYTEAEPGTVLRRENHPDEYMVFFPDKEVIADIESEAGSAADVNYKLAIVPPGTSSIVVKAGGRVLRLFSAASNDLCTKSYNAGSYEQPHPNIPPFQSWPDPPAGFRLRLYPMDPPDEPGRFGRLYRSTNLMINLLAVTMVPRDPNKMSPHYHDDFEQCSLTLHGDYMHYIRWPWTSNKSIWRDDAKIRCSAPSMTVIPPPAIHTSQALPDPPCQLIDIFSPPRADFSLKPGWVLNAQDYPMP